MTPSAERHMQKYRYARTSTLVWLELRDAKTLQLQREIRARKPIWRRILDAIISGWWAI